MAVSPDNVPIPDPSALTTAQLLRELAALEKLFNEKFAGVAISFNGRDIALAAALLTAERSTTEIKAAFSMQTAGILREISDVQRRVSLLEGTSRGIGISWQVVTAIVLVIAAAVGAIVAIVH